MMKKIKLSSKEKIDNSNRVHSHLGNILTTNRNFKNGIYNLKNSGNYPVVCDTCDFLIKSSGHFLKYFYGNPFPKTLEELGVSQRNFKAENLQAELNWIFLSVRKYKIELAIFLNYKKEFENYFVCGDYTKALDTIDKCISELGFSVWAISCKLIIYEYSSSQDKAKLLSSEILQKNRKGWTSSLINFISQRSEKKLSAYKFDEDLNQSLNSAKTNLAKVNREYYLFQLSFFEKSTFNEIKDVLTFDYTNSIIDRYLSLRRALFYLISKNIELEKSLENLSYILKRLPDDLFNGFCLLFNPDLVPKSFYDSHYLKILDLYYAGLYEECSSEIKRNFEIDPTNFTLINIYARSLVLSKQPFSSLIDNPCIANEIAENIYAICKKNSPSGKPIYNLYQISKNLDSFDLNFQLNSFIKSEQSEQSDKSYFYFSFSKADPKICDLLNDRIDLATSVIDRIKEHTYNSIALSYSINSLKGDFDSTLEVDYVKSFMGKAKFLFNENKLEESLSLWLEIYAGNKDMPPILEVAADYIFRIYAQQENIDECILWYVNNYLENQHIVAKINTTSLHLKLKKGRFKNVTINIYLPIFISLISEDENEIGFAVELFCKKNDAIMPSDLIDSENVLKDSLFELFYNISCNNENLNHYRHIRTTKKRLEERITICNYLVKLNLSSTDKYIEELGLLTNELIIYEGVLKLDESKIYANDQAILNNELDEYEGLYNRYVSIAGLYLKNIKILTVNKNELKFLNKKNNVEFSENDIEYSDQAYLDSFYNVFSVIRNRFLNSRFGIVTYLSTRIRHGVFLGELRPELEKRNLIFYKNQLKDKYEPTQFWQKNTTFTQTGKEKIIQLIIGFSNKIDSLINTIIQENIQINTEDEVNETGWFNYNFSNAELGELAVQLYYEQDYKTFCKKALEILWIRTDQNLNIIRDVLQDQIKAQFVKILSDFESDLYLIPEAQNMPELFTSVSESSTNLQLKIDKISNWFKRSGRTHADFDLKNLTNIICFNVQKRYPHKTLNVTIEHQFTHEIQGEYYEHFNDFIMIYIDNMLKHTSREIINAKIKIVSDESLFAISLESDSPSTDNSFLEAEGVSSIKLVTEGKSGLSKAFKIIKDDLGNANNTVRYFPTSNSFRIVATINYLNLIK